MELEGLLHYGVKPSQSHIVGSYNIYKVYIIYIGLQK